MKVFLPGDRVAHAHFGYNYATVLRQDGTEVTIEFDREDRKEGTHPLPDFPGAVHGWWAFAEYLTHVEDTQPEVVELNPWWDR